MPQTVAPVARALISVSDKTGLVELARELAALGVTLVSTGGSARALAEAGLAVAEVAEVTGFPEILGGRVKTLHPKVHGGILARRGVAEDAAALAEHAIDAIDLVAVNLYPFEATVAGGAGFAAAIENIDIGGPALIRAAAKNHAHVAVLVDPEDYGGVVAELKAAGGICEATRRALAAKAFARTAAYDAAIAAWWEGQQGEDLPARMSLSGRLAQRLRYGENPHQIGGLYATSGAGIAAARQVQGKELSYNNIADADAALALIADLGAAAPAIAVIKHANPCGVARGGSLAEAHARAVACDPVSAFGGIVAASHALDRACAEAIASLFTEVVVAPGADEAALAVLAARRDLRLLLVDGLPDPEAPGRMVRSIAGGFLVQSLDTARISAGDLKVVTRRAPTTDELVDLVFAFRIAKHVKSNAIVFAKDSATVGIGAGQMSRVDSVRIAALKAKDAAAAAGAEAPLTQGSVVASDAFYPFPDALEAAIAAGATAAIQPGGSRNDEAVVAAADAAGIAMAFTGVRHFRH